MPILMANEGALNTVELSANNKIIITKFTFR